MYDIGMRMAEGYGKLIDVLADAVLSFRVQATRCGTATRVMSVLSKAADATSQVFIAWFSIAFVVLETFCGILGRLY